MPLRNILFRIYLRCKALIVPQLKYSQYLYEDLIKIYINPEVVWLDLGCGHRLLPPWRFEEEQILTQNCKMVIGLDCEFDALRTHKTFRYRVRGNACLLPFKENFFDIATANMVVEHLDNPEVVFQEIARILKPNGIFIFHTPNAFAYSTILSRIIPNKLKNKIIHILEGRKEEDIFQTYYKANSHFRIKKLAQLTSFKVRKIKMISSEASFVNITPLAIFELIFIKITLTKPFKIFRTNIIAILQKSLLIRKPL